MLLVSNPAAQGRFAPAAVARGVSLEAQKILNELPPLEANSAAAALGAKACLSPHSSLGKLRRLLFKERLLEGWGGETSFAERLRLLGGKPQARSTSCTGLRLDEDEELPRLVGENLLLPEAEAEVSAEKPLTELGTKDAAADKETPFLGTCLQRHSAAPLQEGQEEEEPISRRQDPPSATRPALAASLEVELKFESLELQVVLPELRLVVVCGETAPSLVLDFLLRLEAKRARFKRAASSAPTFLLPSASCTKATPIPAAPTVSAEARGLLRSLPLCPARGEEGRSCVKPSLGEGLCCSEETSQPRPDADLRADAAAAVACPSCRLDFWEREEEEENTLLAGEDQWAPAVAVCTGERCVAFFSRSFSRIGESFTTPVERRQSSLAAESISANRASAAGSSWTGKSLLYPPKWLLSHNDRRSAAASSAAVARAPFLAPFLRSATARWRFRCLYTGKSTDGQQAGEARLLCAARWFSAAPLRRRTIFGV